MGGSEWLARQAGIDGVDILSVCTGIFICGAAGILKGKSICGPRAMQDRIKEKNFGQASLKGLKLRWTRDGNFWSCGTSVMRLRYPYPYLHTRVPILSLSLSLFLWSAVMYV